MQNNKSLYPQTQEKIRLYMTIHDIHGFGGTERVVINLSWLLWEKFEIYIISYLGVGDNSLPPLPQGTQIIYLHHNFKKSLFDKLAFNLKINALLPSGHNVLLAHCNHFFPFIKKPHTLYVRLEHYDFSFLFAKYIHKTPLFPRVRFFDTLVILSHTQKHLFSKLNKHIKVIPNFLPYISESCTDITQRRIIAVGRLSKEKGFIRLIDIWNIVQEKLRKNVSLQESNLTAPSSLRGGAADEAIHNIESKATPKSIDCHENPSGFSRNDNIESNKQNMDYFANTHNALSDWQLVIVGSGDMKEEIEAKIKAKNLQDSIILKPFTKDIESEYLNASIYAMSSHFEGFGMVLVEASSLGLPCIAFDVATGPSDIIDSGLSGYLIEDNDLQAYANKLLELMSDEAKRKAMGECAKKRVATHFSKEAILPLWEELLSGGSK